MLEGDKIVKHIVFIVGSYYPNFSAVGNCVNNVVSCIKDKCKVTVICCVSKTNQRMEIDHEGYKIIRVSSKNMLRRLSIEDKIDSSRGIYRRLNKFILIGLKAKNYLSAFFSKYNVEKKLTEEYYNALRGINEHIDGIIPACIPFEGVLAAVKFSEENDCKVIPYFFDPFADNIALHRTKFNLDIKMFNHLKLEEYVIKNTSYIIIMNHMKKHFYDSFPQYMYKYILMEHPTLKFSEEHYNRVSINNEVNITYAGAFNKGIREPDYLLKIISSCREKVKLNLYSMGNCNGIIKEYASAAGSNIINHGSVDKNTAYIALLEADILINIGNMVSNQTPSKIFEYIALGKPIIHLYYNETDAVNTILSKYPCALCIKQDETLMDKNAKMLIDFCEENLGFIMPVEKIKETYPEALPETTSNAILKLIN